ncbi:MAG: hypothetical protein KBE32_04145, partial [Leptotrichiaceae bacterium]|nr:hypothetical protein [Leptotrichiaceae bacterium]MBP9876198.1 hypothetical protein [Leptotrichiaceae bacterium]
MSELVVNETNPSIDSRRNYDTISTISVDEVFKKKMNFLGLVQQILGVIMVIFGGLYCLTIIGAILGVPFILIGLKMFKSGEAYKKSIITLEGGDIKEGLTLFSDAMKIYIIMIVVILVIEILFLIVFMGTILS